MASQIAPHDLAAGDRLTIDFTNAHKNADNPGRSRYAWTVTGTAFRQDGDAVTFVAGLVWAGDGTEIRLAYDLADGVWALERPRDTGEWFRWNTPESVDIHRGDLTGE